MAFAVLDTIAALLWATGQQQAAVAMQRRALTSEIVPSVIDGSKATSRRLQGPMTMANVRLAEFSLAMGKFDDARVLAAVVLTKPDHIATAQRARKVIKATLQRACPRPRNKRTIADDHIGSRPLSFFSNSAKAQQLAVRGQAGPAAPPRRPRFFRAVRWLILLGIVIPALQCALLNVIDPPVTGTMLTRTLERGWEVGDWSLPAYEFVALTAMPKHVVIAALSSEDRGFFQHHGFDEPAIRRAWKRYRTEPDKPLIGGSTISQQVARNVFLTQNRSWIRKGLEAYYTLWLELLVPKSAFWRCTSTSLRWGRWFWHRKRRAVLVSQARLPAKTD